MGYGSLDNKLRSNSPNPEPWVGMGVTELMWTDRCAWTVVAIGRSGREVTIQRDHAQRTDTNGQSESQTYAYKPNPEGELRTISLRKNGRWVLVGQSMKSTAYLLGRREEYSDPSF